ncbi:MAG: DUF4388 domain-containing protein [Syntrophales bacterium]
MPATNNIKLIVDNKGENFPARSGRRGLYRWPLAGFSLSSFLQVIAMDQQTCLLDVYNPTNNREGHFYFISGSLYSAECGVLKNEEAALEMISWENARFNIRHLSDTANIAKRISKNLMLLLMESSKRIDEKKADDTGKAEPSEDSREKYTDKIASIEPDKEGAASYQDRYHNTNWTECLTTLERDMGPALIGTAIIDAAAGKIMAGCHGAQATAGLFHKLAGSLRRILPGGSFESLGRYYLLDLKSNLALIALLFGRYHWGIIFSREKMELGLFLHVIVPRLIKTFEYHFSSFDEAAQ